MSDEVQFWKDMSIPEVKRLGEIYGIPFELIANLPYEGLPSILRLHILLMSYMTNQLRQMEKRVQRSLTRKLSKALERKTRGK